MIQTAETDEGDGSRIGKYYQKVTDFFHQEPMINNAWVLFLLRSLRKQQEMLQHKAEMEQRLEKLSPLSARLAALARERGRLTITGAVTLLAVNRNTAQLHIRQLVAQGSLIQHGTGKATWYPAGS